MKNHEGYHDQTGSFRPKAEAHQLKSEPVDFQGWRSVGVPSVTSKMILIKFKTVILV